MMPCLDCGRPSMRRRCGVHEAAWQAGHKDREARGLGYEHMRIARRIVSEATVCALCHLPPTSDDPLVADHIRARVDGGQSTRANLQATHRSCNSRKGRGGGRIENDEKRPPPNRSAGARLDSGPMVA